MEELSEQATLHGQQIKERPADYSLTPSRQVYSDNPDAICPGNKVIADCATTRGLLIDAEKEADMKTFNVGGEVWREFHSLDRTCETCSAHCEAAIRTIDTVPMEPIKLTFYKRRNRAALFLSKIAQRLVRS